MTTPPTIAEPLRIDGEVVGMRIVHPPGVDCAFIDNECSCGRLRLGVVEPEPGLTAENHLPGCQSYLPLQGYCYCQAGPDDWSTGTEWTE